MISSTLRKAGLAAIAAIGALTLANVASAHDWRNDNDDWRRRQYWEEHRREEWLREQRQNEWLREQRAREWRHQQWLREHRDDRNYGWWR